MLDVVEGLLIAGGAGVFGYLFGDMTIAMKNAAKPPYAERGVLGPFSAIERLYSRRITEKWVRDGLLTPADIDRYNERHRVVGG